MPAFDDAANLRRDGHLPVRSCFRLSSAGEDAVQVCVLFQREELSGAKACVNHAIHIVGKRKHADSLSDPLHLLWCERRRGSLRVAAGVQMKGVVLFDNVVRDGVFEDKPGHRLHVLLDALAARALVDALLEVVRFYQRYADIVERFVPLKGCAVSAHGGRADALRMLAFHGKIYIPEDDIAITLHRMKKRLTILKGFFLCAESSARFIFLMDFAGFVLVESDGDARRPRLPPLVRRACPVGAGSLALGVALLPRAAVRAEGRFAHFPVTADTQRHDEHPYS